LKETRVSPNVHYSTIARTWKQPRYPLTDEWIQKLWYIYTMEYYSAIKKNVFKSTLKKRHVHRKGSVYLPALDLCLTWEPRTTHPRTSRGLFTQSVLCLAHALQPSHTVHLRMLLSAQRSFSGSLW